MSTNTMPLEAETRVLIDRSLENLGWILNGKDQNVYYEQPRSDAEKKKLGGKRPDYVLYSKESDKPLIVIEAKKKGSRIDAALEQGISYARALEAPLVFATDGVFCKAFHTIANRPPILNGEEIDEFIREALALRYLKTYEVNTVSPKVQYDRKELIRIFDEANNMLRGDGLRAGIERFGEFANILFLKLVSEIEQIKRENGTESKFDIASCSWDSIKNIAPSARIEYINNTVYKRLNDLYKTEIFTPLTIRDESILKEIMDKLDPLMLTDVDSDVKGDAFEYFLKASTSTKNDLGEYFTPRHIVKTMVRLVNPQIGETVYDPFCGTGGFLIESFRHIYNNMARTEANLKTLRESTVYGNEITNTARITKMNMILAGDGHSNIQMLDSLANPVDGTKTYTDENGVTHHKGYDIVLANMPYSQKTKHGNLYDLPSTNGDSICVQHCIKAINSAAENGRMALVVPEGFLFRKDLTKAREFLLDNCELQSIISLPQGVFLPYTGVKTDIIYATKVNKKVRLSEKRKDFWYFDVKSDGYTLDNHRRKLDTPSDLSKYEEYRKLDKDQASDMLKVGFEIIPLDKVCKNSCILVGARYRTNDAAIVQSSWPLVKVGDLFDVVSDTINPQDETGPTTYIGLENIESLTGRLIGNLECEISSIRSAKRVFRKSDILFGKLRPALNKVAYPNTDGICSTDIIVLRAKATQDVFPELYSLILRSSHFNKMVLNGVTGGQLPRIDTQYLLELPICKIPIELQQNLVNDFNNYQQIIVGAQAIVSNYVPQISCNSENYRPLEEIAIFKPSKEELKELPGETEVSFVPMATINTFDASFEVTEIRELRDVLGSFTYFRDGDVLLAKITPCFENGKAGIACNLKNGIGFGSTEYIVIRADQSVVYPEWIFYHINTQSFIDGGKSFMTGTAGQQRVDINYVKQFRIPVPSLEDQRKILDRIRYEQTLIESSKKLIKIFTGKIEERIKEVWGE